MNKKVFSHSNQLLEQLARNSTPYQDPLTRINWDSLHHDHFWLPQQAISLYGLNEYESLPKAQKRALSQYEFLNFVEACLWLESVFVARISTTVRKLRHRQARHIYRLHELREEIGHILMFCELMRRCGLVLPNTRFRQLRPARLFAKYAPFESIMFWMVVLIGEEVQDRMNRFIRKNAEELCPAVYDIVSTHIIDEGRHIAHARETLEQLLHYSSRVKTLALQPMINRIFKKFIDAFYFPPARVYELAGLTPGKRWTQAVRRNAHRLQFIDECVTSTLHVLKENKIQLKWR